METAIAIRLPKGMDLNGATLIKYKDGRLFVKIKEEIYKIVDFPLEIPKYTIAKNGDIVSKITSRGIVKK